MYVCMYVSNVCMHVCMYVCMYVCNVCLYVCMSVCLYVYVYMKAAMFWSSLLPESRKEPSAASKSRRASTEKALVGPTSKEGP